MTFIFKLNVKRAIFALLLTSIYCFLLANQKIVYFEEFDASANDGYRLYQMSRTYHSIEGYMYHIVGKSENQYLMSPKITSIPAGAYLSFEYNTNNDNAETGESQLEIIVMDADANKSITDKYILFGVTVNESKYFNDEETKRLIKHNVVHTINNDNNSVFKGWQSIFVPLADYAGQDVHVMWLYTASSGNPHFMIDNIKVFVPLDYDLLVKNIVRTMIMTVGSETNIKVTVSNEGRLPVSDYTIRFFLVNSEENKVIG